MLKYAVSLVQSINILIHLYDLLPIVLFIIICKTQCPFTKTWASNLIFWKYINMLKLFISCFWPFITTAKPIISTGSKQCKSLSCIEKHFHELLNIDSVGDFETTVVAVKRLPSSE